MVELVTGYQLIEEFNLSPPDLFLFIQNGELTPKTWQNGKICRPDRKPPRYVESLESRKQGLELQKCELRCQSDIMMDVMLEEPIPALKIKHINDEIEAIEIELKSIKTDYEDPFNWTNYRLPEDKADANAFIKFLCTCYYLRDEIDRMNEGRGLQAKRTHEPTLLDNSNRKNLLPAQRHRLSVVRVARTLWEENPTITIAEMVYLDAINQVCEGRVYKENTIRNWIKDYCPNRAPGRRPKAKRR